MLISIITATYNRAYCLDKLYDSLIHQCCYNFEWIVVDDGSTDNTIQLVEKWKNETNKFNIKYFKQENGGKHRAINSALTRAEGDYTFIVDSDDYLIEKATKLVELWVMEIDDDKRYAGVSGVRGEKERNEIVGMFPKNMKYVDSNNVDRWKNNLLGDKAEVYRTEILKKYPFPEIENEKFIGESVVWDEIAHDGYILRWHREILIICEYLEDGLTHNYEKKILNNPKGYALVKRKVYKYYSFPYNLRALAAYIEFDKKRGKHRNEIMQNFEIGRLEYAIGIFLYVTKKILKRVMR